MGKMIEKLEWRYAVKQFDANKKLSSTQVEDLKKALNLSASSFGLQPWKFVFIDNQELKDQLRTKSWNQPQISDCSHLIVLCRQDSITDNDVDRFIKSTAETRGQDPFELEGYSGMMKGFLSRMDEEQKVNWMRNQVYIALGSLLTACAAMEIDSCPVEGFDANSYDDILKLDDHGLKSVVVCPVGFRSDSDKYAQAKKVRYSVSETTLTIP